MSSLHIADRPKRSAIQLDNAMKQKKIGGTCQMCNNVTLKRLFVVFTVDNQAQRWRFVRTELFENQPV